MDRETHDVVIISTSSPSSGSSGSYRSTMCRHRHPCFSPSLNDAAVWYLRRHHVCHMTMYTPRCVFLQLHDTYYHVGQNDTPSRSSPQKTPQPPPPPPVHIITLRSSTTGQASPTRAGTPGLKMPAFSRPINSTVSPKIFVWSSLKKNRNKVGGNR